MSYKNYKCVPQDGNGRPLSNRKGRAPNDFDCIWMRSSSEAKARAAAFLVLKYQGYRVRTEYNIFIGWR